MASLPGMITNLRKPIIYEASYLGVKHSLYASELEYTMQNVVDSLLTSFLHRCHSTVMYNEKRKVTSPAKGSLHQTPDGSLLDVIRNKYDLLISCIVQMHEA